MEIEERREQMTMVLSPVGRLDGAGAPILEARVCGIAGRGATVMVLDCSRIGYISSAGLRTLLVCAKLCLETGGAMTVAALQPQCRKIVTVSGLLTVLDHYETCDAAVRARGRPPPARRRKRPERQNGRTMTIEEAKNGSAVVLFLIGELNSAGAHTLEERVSKVVEEGCAIIVLDCVRMTYVNSSGLHALLVCAKSCLLEGGRLVIADLQSQCRSVVDMSGFPSVIEHYETRDAALAALAN